MPAYQPDRAHFVTLNFTPQAGTEQAGHRPALVLSPKSFNIATGLCMVCPVTNQGKGGSFEVPVPATARVTGFILSDQMRSVDWLARDAKYHSDCPAETIAEVLGRIEAILEIDCL